MLRPLVACLVLPCVLSGVALSQPQRRPMRPRNPWAVARAPAPGKADAIGTYTAGCLRGAASLPLQGLGYRAMHPSRRFGHPTLVSFVQMLGHRAAAGGLRPLAVGDLGQPRGGPAPRGHASHQIGLDADIWYLPPRQAFRLSPITGLLERWSVIDRRQGRLEPRWAARVRLVLELAAADPRVAKIMVNPAIKRSLCESVTGDRAWLGKLQPWWGHDRHFHVQLSCPADSPSCRPNPPLPRGDGCEQIEWWFSTKTVAERQARRAAYRARVGTGRGIPALPAQCAELLR